MNERMRGKRIDRASIQVLFQMPFFAPGVARLPVVWDESVGTACTDGERILWNPVWFDTLKDNELVTVLCEEVGHCLLGHLWRAPLGCEFRDWNIACDHAVRLMMQEFGEDRVRQNYANPFGFPEGSLPNKKYSGWSEEAIFADLMKNQPPAGSGNGSGRSGGRSTPQSSGKSGPSGQQGAGQSPKGQGQTQSPAPFAEFQPPKAGAGSQKQKDQETDWKNTLFQSVAMAKQRGDVPGSIARLVDEIVHPQVPWQEIMRTWLREKCNDDWNWMKPNVYYGGEFMLPSLDSERMGRVVFATDTSGSIDDKVLAQFQAEKQSCLDDMKPSALLDLCCDAKITQEKEYRLGDQIDGKCPGGGGTRFEPVFEHLEELPEKPKLVVYLTDLMGSFPKQAPDYPVLWIVFGNEHPQQPPFGEVVVIK